MTRGTTWLALLTATACTQRLGNFATLAKSELTGPPSERAEKRAEGKDCVWYALFVPLGTPDPDVAIARALKDGAEGDWDGLEDASLELRWWWALATGKICYRVSGIPVRLPRAEAEEEAPAEEEGEKDTVEEVLEEAPAEEPPTEKAAEPDEPAPTGPPPKKKEDDSGFGDFPSEEDEAEDEGDEGKAPPRDFTEGAEEGKKDKGDDDLFNEDDEGDDKSKKRRRKKK